MHLPSEACILAACLAVVSWSQPGLFLDSLMLSDSGYSVAPRFTTSKVGGRTCVFFDRDSALSYIWLDEFSRKEVRTLRKPGNYLRGIHAGEKWLAFAANNRTVGVFEMEEGFRPVFDTTFESYNTVGIHVLGDRVAIAQRSNGVGLIDLAGKPSYRRYLNHGTETVSARLHGDWILANLEVTRIEGDSLSGVAYLGGPYGVLRDWDALGDTVIATAYDAQYNAGSIRVFDLKRLPEREPLVSGSWAGDITGIGFAHGRIFFAEKRGLYWTGKDIPHDPDDTAFTHALAVRPKAEFRGDFAIHGDTVIVVEGAPLPESGYAYHLSLYRLDPALSLREGRLRAPLRRPSGGPWSADGKRRPSAGTARVIRLQARP